MLQENGDESSEGGINAVGQAGKCSRCGSRKHSAAECSTDLSKVRCFRCNSHGHVSLNCPKKQSSEPGGTGGFSGSKGNGNQTNKGNQNTKGKSKGKGKDHGKSKGFGKKGKLNEISENRPLLGMVSGRLVIRRLGCRGLV